MGPMISGVSSIIFASGDRMSERKPRQRDGRDRLRQAGEPRFEQQARPASGAAAAGAAAAPRAGASGWSSCPWYCPTVVR